MTCATTKHKPTFESHYIPEIMPSQCAHCYSSCRASARAQRSALKSACMTGAADLLYIRACQLGLPIRTAFLLEQMVVTIVCHLDLVLRLMAAIRERGLFEVETGKSM
ncbi:hypothetical protein GMOD_00004469 [Pyrenophora seminiperda CCB06]|uniref:Uncharacterized protein n=1 Tax=Pyrenophora seminiperda CCB06 TaxID=1302712 RepID=A0A3M7M175_9PLEO|nr:hypothetical protein GMOD_00004469 [Pyrenophora seminiperda CCB06]